MAAHPSFPDDETITLLVPDSGLQVLTLSGVVHKFKAIDAGLADDFRSTVAACRAAERFGGLVLLVDEVGDLARECAEELQGLHRNGHKDGVASVLASPCATDFPKRCRDTASRVFSFFQKNAADRRALADEYGDDFATAAATWRYPNPPAAWLNPTLHD